jgi:DnaJ-class molecular chaperone with C-terminal Zn finger domain
LHPDDPKAQEKFKEINEAYEVLGDEEKERNTINLANTDLMEENNLIHPNLDLVISKVEEHIPILQTIWAILVTSLI